MNPETVSLLSLGEHDAELAAKITRDIERVVLAYLQTNMHVLAAAVVTQESYNIERMAVKALKAHLNNTIPN
jgi:hypothetical protein